MDYRSWRNDLKADSVILRHLYAETSKISATEDHKLQTLLEQIKQKITHPINGNNKKIIILQHLPIPPITYMSMFQNM